MSLLLPGEETAVIESGRKFARHHHAEAYAGVLVHGTCHEMGDCGRFRAVPGDVFVHTAFDGHSDIIGRSGAVFINLSVDEQIGAWHGRLVDLDAVVRAYERDQREAAALLKEQFRAREASPPDWPDLLASELRKVGRFSLEEWADAHGLHPSTVSRGFRRAFDISPQRFRLEQMASHAARSIRATRDSFAAIAARHGFSDQAHMSRTIGKMFRTTPAALRRAVHPVRN